MGEILRLRPGAVEWREIEGEVVALDLRRSTYVAVNRSGAALWPALVEGASRPQLVETLINAYGLEPDAAGADVEAFLASLAECDLLEPQA
jgi:hypothetical protein